MGDRPEPIGRLFPLGGPVPPALVIGRDGELQEIERRLREGMSTMLDGQRRIGKTTVCAAVCDLLRRAGVLVIELDVPERPDSRDLLQLIIDTCRRVSLEARGRAALHAARPLLEKILADQGVPLDLSGLGTSPDRLPTREVLSLPVTIAQQQGRHGVLFLDELQRVVDYEDGDQLLIDFVDLYSGSDDVVVLVDGSDQRALKGMFGAPVHFGKLVDRLTLDPTIPLTTWRQPLTERFARAGLQLDDAVREELLTWSGGRPYETMAAARFTALAARKTDSEVVSSFDLRMGLDDAQRHLRDDGA